jgi:enamine deaminase RidA (YjgF/YER057c/UK114 family)
MRTIATPDAPRAIGPYSQAMLTGGQVYTAGQIALDPVSMELVQGDVAEQTERVMQNLRAILEAAGSGMSSVIKTTVTHRHGRLRGDERGLRPPLRGAPAGALDGGGEDAAQERAGRD